MIRPRRVRGGIGLGVALALLLAGCGTVIGAPAPPNHQIAPMPVPSDSPSAAVAPPCEGAVAHALGCTVWRAVSARDATGVLGWMTETPVTLGGMVLNGYDLLGVDNVVNFSSIPATVSGEVITPDRTAPGGSSTLVGCVPGYGTCEHEAWVDAFFALPLRFAVAGTHLTLANARGEIRLEAVRSPLQALGSAFPDNGGTEPTVDAHQLGDVTVGWSPDHSRLNITTLGSSACPLVPLALEGQGRTIVLGPDLTQPRACGTDRARITTILAPPPGWAASAPITRADANGDIRLTITG